MHRVLCYIFRNAAPRASTSPPAEDDKAYAPLIQEGTGSPRYTSQMSDRRTLGVRGSMPLIHMEEPPLRCPPHRRVDGPGICTCGHGLGRLGKSQPHVSSELSKAMRLA